MQTRILIFAVLVGIGIILARGKFKKQKMNNPSTATQQTNTQQANTPQTDPSSTQSTSTTPSVETTAVEQAPQESDEPMFNSEQEETRTLEEQLRALPNANQTPEEKNEAKKRALQEFNAQIKASQDDVGTDQDAARWNGLNAKRAAKIKAQEAAAEAAGKSQ